MAQFANAQEMLASLGEVREYRETMTRQAAGVIWIIWGLAVAAIGLYHLAYFLGSPGTAGPGGTAFVIFGGAGALATNAVWRGHALERDRQHKAWVAWLVGIGVPMTVGALIMASNWLARGSGSTAPDPAFMLAPLLMLGSVGAFLLTVLMRHHVPPVPGYVGAALLMVGFALARYLPLERQVWLDTVGNAGLSLVNLVTFAIIGWIHIRRG